MTNVTNQVAVDVIRNQMAAALKTQLDGHFVVIRYPPGFNFNTQYGSMAYYNPHTFELLDQLVKTTGDGLASLTGSSFSNKFGAILRSVGYVTSTTDKAAQGQAVLDFNTQAGLVLAEFETSFGTITDVKITASGCRPATKTGYILNYIATNFPGDPPTFGWAYATFESAYATWRMMGLQIEKTSAGPRNALDTVAAALQSATNPSALNGGLQTSSTTWTVGYVGLPSTGAISSSLSDVSRTATVRFTLQNQSSAPQAVQNPQSNAQNAAQSVVSLPLETLKLRVAPSPKIPAHPRAVQAVQNASPASVPDALWNTATKIDMQIIYVGLTIVRADPSELATDLKSGWFTRQILADIVHKTGHDVTGLQLKGSSFSADQLFGPNKTFARVRTFVISQEPTVKLTLYGSGSAGLASHFQANQNAELDLGDLLSLGSGAAKYGINNVSTSQGSVTITLAPPKQIGTTPSVDQTAHIIGGVIEFPPN